MMQIDKVPIELYGQGFVPMLQIYYLMLWLIQQPVPVPQQPRWSPQGHCQTGAWLITRVSESCSWCDGSVAKHKPFRHLLLPFCHLFLDQTLSSAECFHIWPKSNSPASSHQAQMIACKDQDPGALVNSQDPKILPQVNFLCLRTWRDRELPGALGAVRMGGRATLKNINKVILVCGAGWTTSFFKWEKKICKLRHLRITAHICTAQRN